MTVVENKVRGSGLELMERLDSVSEEGSSKDHWGLRSVSLARASEDLHWSGHAHMRQATSIT